MCRSSSFPFAACNRAEQLIYQPMLLGASHVRVSDGKGGMDMTQEVTVLAPISDGAVAVNWEPCRGSGWPWPIWNSRPQMVRSSEKSPAGEQSQEL